MQRTLRAFLANIVDYAGIFPPAKLPLDEAWRNYLQYRTLPHAWLLGRFICPAARLTELDSVASSRPLAAAGPEPVTLSILGRSGENAQEYFANVKTDLADLARLREMHGDRMTANTYEVRLPAKSFTPAKANQIASLIATTIFLLESSGQPPLVPFFEAPHNDRATLLALIQALHDHRHTSPQPPRAGFKLRAGGVEAGAFPPTELVALALAACQAVQVPLKATAGLHHPFPHRDASLGVKMHGFVNLFATGCFLWNDPSLARRAGVNDPSLARRAGV
ncbi:MAG: hypothetical protein L0215_21145, partial [Gemmataceae bacterium]|nr:hypothetical protein [Gemmataceae bacterium]